MRIIVYHLVATRYRCDDDDDDDDDEYDEDDDDDDNNDGDNDDEDDDDNDDDDDDDDDYDENHYTDNLCLLHRHEACGLKTVEVRLRVDYLSLLFLSLVSTKGEAREIC